MLQPTLWRSRIFPDPGAAGGSTGIDLFGIPPREEERPPLPGSSLETRGTWIAPPTVRILPFRVRIDRILILISISEVHGLGRPTLLAANQASEGGCSLSVQTKV